MRYALLFLLISSSAAAQDRDAFFGLWGTEKQCARAAIKPGGTVLAEPFEINAGWLRQGNRWCRLNWFPVAKRQNGLFSGANAMCGEDSVQGYLLGMELADDQLTLRWDFPHKNGPLSRCGGG